MPPADPTKPRLPREAYFLTIRQAPTVGKCVGSKPSDRKPVDPPPIVRLQIKDFSDPAQNYLQSPYFMCVGTLWDPKEDKPAQCGDESQPPMAGTLVSSLHKLKDVNNEDAGFFVFGDLSVKPEGEFRLRFVLYELLEGEVICLQWATTEIFRVYPSKTFPGLQESSFISRSFGDQGVRLRIRKDGRTTSKRNAKSQNVGEEGGYESKSQANTTPTSQQSNHMYGGDVYSSRAYSGADTGLVKRQRTSHDFSQPSFDRGDAWQYSSAPNSAGLYPSSSSYSQEVVPASHHGSYPYRSSQSSLGQGANIYQRPEYQSGSHLGYDPRSSYSQGDPSTGLSNYSDQSGYTTTNSTDPTSDLSPSSHNSTAYSSLSDPTLRQNIQQSIRLPSTPSSNVLPLPFNPAAPAGSPSSYNYNPSELRYNTQAGGNPGMRGAYSGYPGYQMQSTQYPST